MDVSAFDLEEMDEAEREELEAMLYAQVHHAAPDATEVVEPLPPEPALPPGPADIKIGQPKTLTTRPEEPGVLTNGFGHSPPAAVKGEAEAVHIKPDAAVGACLPAVTDTPASTRSSRDLRSDVPSGAGSNIQRAAERNGPQLPADVKPAPTNLLTATGTNPSASSSRSDTSTAIAPSSSSSPPVPAEPSQPRSDPPPHQDPAPAAPSPTPVPRAAKRPLSPASSGDEPETKTAALAAGERRRRRRRPPTELVTVHGSSSESSTDEYVMEADALLPASVSGAAPSAKIDPGEDPSPVVVDVEESPSPAPEVISLGEDSQPSSPKPSTSSATTAAAATASCSAAAAAGTGKAQQKTAVLTRRARSLGGAETLAALTQRRPRTSSDLSSSEEDSDGGAALVANCDITMNVRGAGRAPAAAGRAGSGPRREEAVAEQEGSRNLGLPAAACRRVLGSARLTGAEHRRLEPLCLTRPCFKWSDQQRAGYTTPKHYGPEDVDSIQATMSEHGWDIPVAYLQRSAGGRATKARYYSNLMKNRCRRCDEVGHVMAACPMPPVCHLCGEKGHTGEFRCPNMFCFMCGRPDHPTRRCPRHVQPVFCALCKAAGHVAEQCADRWRRYHATTSAGPLVAPPATLENRPGRRVFCWECGQRGHHGHHCGDERYTSAASLSQHVISYTETTCPSREVPGIVATPAQMDAVFAPKRRRRLEDDTGASLTYEQLGDKSWLINISGSLEAARAAHEHVQAVLQGKKRPRPRPNSAPASPVHAAEPEGATSLPVTPEPPLSPEIPDGVSESKKAARERRRLLKEARLAERRRKRQADAAARQAQAQAAGVDPPAVIDVDSRSGEVVDVDSRSGDECVDVTPLDVTVVGEVSGRAAAARRVETVILLSDDEDLSAGCQPGPALDALTDAGRGWDLSLLDGPGKPAAGAQRLYAGEVVMLSRKQRQRRRIKERKQMRKQIARALLLSEELAEDDAESLLRSGRSTSAPATAGPSREPAEKHEGPNTMDGTTVMQKVVLESQLAELTKTSLKRKTQRRLPDGWEQSNCWRKILLDNGVDRSLVPGSINKSIIRAVNKARVTGTKGLWMKVLLEKTLRGQGTTAMRKKGKKKKKDAGLWQASAAGKGARQNGTVGSAEEC